MRLNQSQGLFVPFLAMLKSFIKRQKTKNQNEKDDVQNTLLQSG